MFAVSDADHSNVDKNATMSIKIPKVMRVKFIFR